MARKKSKKNENASKVSLSGDNVHPVNNIYKLLARMDIIKSLDDLVVPYDLNGSHVSIAIPGIKFGIAFEGDITDKLEADGWHIQRIAFRDVESFSRVYFSIEAARVADLYSRADPNVKTTSQAEERIFSEIIRRGLPVPDRNLKFTRENGTELTTPDFAWEEYNLAFFMDGAYWHSVKDDQAIIKEIKSSKKMTDSIVEKRKDKVRKDASIRSELGSMGWIVLACTDDDVEDSEGLHEIVDMIERTLRKAEASRQFRESVSMSDERSNAIDDLLSSTPSAISPEDNPDDQEDDSDNSDDDHVPTASPQTPLESPVSASEDENDLDPTPEVSNAPEDVEEHEETIIDEDGPEDEGSPAPTASPQTPLEAPVSASEDGNDLDPTREDKSAPEDVEEHEQTIIDEEEHTDEDQEGNGKEKNTDSVLDALLGPT